VSDMRSKSLDAVDRVHLQETRRRLDEMTDAQIEALLASGLGYPRVRPSPIPRSKESPTTREGRNYEQF
jgi:hypothetical protein